MSNRCFLTVAALIGLSVAPRAAQASEGPWTTARGLHNLYLGTFYEQFNCFTVDGMASEDCPDGSAAVEEPIRRVGAKVFYRTGLARWADVALSVPVVRASSAAEGAPYATTLGLGTVQAGCAPESARWGRWTSRAAWGPRPARCTPTPGAASPTSATA